MNQSGCSFPQTMVNQTPRFDNATKKRKSSGNQVKSKAGILRPDKRKKVKYL